MVRTDAFIPYEGPYDWPAMRAWLAGRALDGVDSITETGYARTAYVDGVACVVDVTYQPVRSGFVARLASRGRVDPASVVARLVRVLDLDRDLAVMRHRLGHDPRLVALMARHPGLRVPGGWDAFELAVRAVLGQQVTVSAARALGADLVRICGGELPSSLARGGLERTFPTPTAVASADLSVMRMPGSRRETLKALARSVADDPAVLEASTSLEASVSRLRAIPGIGEWTAQYIALRALRHPDAFPASDVGLLRGAADAAGARPSPAQLLARAEAWRPHRAYAAQLLWAQDGTM